MSFVEDIADFKAKYFHDLDVDYDYMLLREILSSEEQQEGLQALLTKNVEEYVDSRIDKIVIAIGDLLALGVDVEEAWAAVHKANMSKVRGDKPGREGMGGKDVYKPEGWVGPDHSGNHGDGETIFNK